MRNSTLVGLGNLVSYVFMQNYPI